MIYGHIKSVVNRPNIPPSLVVRARTSVGTYLLECIVGEHTRIARGSERLTLEEVRNGEFVVAALREHAGWLDAERIDIIKLGIDSGIGIGEAGTAAEDTNRVL